MRDALTLAARLSREARQFEAFQLLRLIECANPDKARLGVAARPAQEPVRLGQDPELRFSSAQVTSYAPADGSMPERVALDFGLLGPQGPMPLHLTEYVRARSRQHGDRAFERFLDLFHHRMSGVRYRAWAACQPVIGLGRRDDDRFAGYVGSLCGLAQGRVSAGSPIDDDMRLGAAGLLGDRRRHAAGLVALLERACEVPVSIEPFIGQWLPAPDEAGVRLGARGRGSLGEGYVLGRRIWDRQQKFRIVFGPLDAVQSERLLPGTRGFSRIVAWVALYVGTTLDVEVELRLKPAAAPPMRLGVKSRLARSTWLGSTNKSHERPVLRFCRPAQCIEDNQARIDLHGRTDSCRIVRQAEPHRL
ncbi:type VI secretion system baseplate subunit TssG [Trinickia soli]|uniref:Type VI secretion system baseplate subunit TssG n=1 Tax=Trinickia soli TaxID=380675 RepID=A0A2N7VXK4_9BURK|nr:type VI secretion system baseplate subunit TssG [Trinickia soli]PMS21885.1 type VI secretion system baseplate subunit TssG [Trinickia soli]CAB3650019.1 hypothetical protein LMG24076_00899 [Trinickia soli]